MSGVVPAPSSGSPGVWLRCSAGDFSFASTLPPLAITSLMMSSAVARSFTLRGGDAVDLAERAHVHGRVERRHVGGVGQVGIGAAFEQHRRGVVVRVPDRAHERRRPFGVGGVDLGAGVEQRRGGVGRAVARRVHQRRPVATRQDREHAFEAEPILRERHRVRPRVHVGAARRPAASPRRRGSRTPPTSARFRRAATPAR